MCARCLLFLPLICAVLLVVGNPAARAAIRTETVRYSQDSTVLEGYLAYDDAFQARRPGVLVIHEWMGITPYERGRVEQLASLGYVAFAADIYGKGVRPATREEAARVSAIYRSNRQLLRARALAGLAVVRNFRYSDPSRLVAIGYCFGGTSVLELARANADVAGVVSFHGGLDAPTPGETRSIRPRVLVLTGADDPIVPPAARFAFEGEMRKAGADWQMIVYGGAVHSFTNPASGSDPSKGVAYNEKADRRSFAAMRQFFGELF
ncbi:MAG: dienelactone hydrolase family protein [Syntrophorhabdales bacterium]|jgi:dienelactone hydrolase